MNNDLYWVADKIKQHLDAGPFILDYKEYEYFDKPVFVYKKFVIYIESEDTITLGFQPYVDETDKDLILKSLSMVIDNIKTRNL